MRVRVDQTPRDPDSSLDTKLGGHVHHHEITHNTPHWIRNPFALESDASDMDEVHITDSHTLDALTSTTALGKQTILVGPKLKPRPAPIYKDKRVEEYWAFLKSIPDHENNHQLPPPSRCPSLMSRGTLSSRNSSTRSTRSSIWDPLEKQEFSLGGMYRVSGCSDFGVSSDARPYSTSSTEQLIATIRCPVRTCEFHLKGFARPMDQKRHIFKHFSGVLECGFCDSVAFSQASDRVSLFLTHLLKKHNACGQLQTSNARAERSDAGSHGSPADRSVATCSICTEPFTAQGYYEHLSGCIIREVARNEDSKPGDQEIPGECQRPSAIESLPMMSDHASGVASSVEDAEGPFEYSAFLSPAKPSEHHGGDVEELTVSSRCLSLTSSKAVESSEEETDWTEEQTSRESSPGTSQIPRRLSSAKRRVVENIMQEFQRLFNESLRNHTSSGHSSSSSGGSARGWSSNTSTYSASAFTSRKRSLSGGGATPPDEDDSNKRQRPDNKASSKKAMSDLRFACPYYKRNPGRHQTFTSCRDPGFTTVARLKEHLYRRHLLPPQCHRCCTTFTNDIALREHQRDPRGCDVREQVPLEGFDKDQERRLKSKKKSQTSQSEEDKWKVVYRVLFPDDDEAAIPTPYIEYQPCTGQTAEPSNVVRFQEFSRLELPRLVRRTLEAVVEQEAQPLEDKMKERLVDIVKECQNQLLSMFQTDNGTNTDDAAAAVRCEQIATLTTVETSSTQATFDPDELFIDFDAYPANKTSSCTASKPQTRILVPQLPTSSNSSDSGYDSTWPATRAPGPRTSLNGGDFSLSTDCAGLGHIEFDECFAFFDNGVEQGASLAADASWSFVGGFDSAGATDQGRYEAQFAAQWHP